MTTCGETMAKLIFSDTGDFLIAGEVMLDFNGFAFIADTVINAVAMGAALLVMLDLDEGLIFKAIFLLIELSCPIPCLFVHFTIWVHHDVIEMAFAARACGDSLHFYEGIMHSLAA